MDPGGEFIPRRVISTVRYKRFSVVRAGRCIRGVKELKYENMTYELTRVRGRWSAGGGGRSGAVPRFRASRCARARGRAGAPVARWVLLLGSMTRPLALPPSLETETYRPHSSRRVPGGADPQPPVGGARAAARR